MQFPRTNDEAGQAVRDHAQDDQPKCEPITNKCASEARCQTAGDGYSNRTQDMINFHRYYSSLEMDLLLGVLCLLYLLGCEVCEVSCSRHICTRKHPDKARSLLPIQPKHFFRRWIGSRKDTIPESRFRQLPKFLGNSVASRRVVPPKPTPASVEMDSGHRGERFFPAEEPHDTRGVKGEGCLVEWQIDGHPGTFGCCTTSNPIYTTPKGIAQLR